MAKTDWQMNDTVLPDDMNQIGQEINDAATAAANAQDAADAAATAAANAQDDIDAHKADYTKHAITAVNVEGFGAVGDWDGSTGTNDTVAIQNAVDYAISIGSNVIFLPHGVTGVYYVSSITNADKVRFIGNNAFFYNCLFPVQQLGASGSGAITPPDGLGYNPPVTIPFIKNNGKAAHDFDVSIFAPTGKTYYVDIKTGNDSNDGLTPATAFKTMNKAISMSDVVVIRVAAGVYYWNYGPTTINKPALSIISEGGKSTFSVHDKLTWTVSAGYTYTYEATRSAVASVWDTQILDKNGDYTPLTQRASIAEVDANPGSWYTDGTKVYVRTRDSREITDDSVRAYLNVDNLKFAANGTLYLENIDFEGGKSAVRVENLAAGNTTKLYAKNVSFKYSSSSNGLTALGVSEAILQNCLAARNYLDGLNYHAQNSVIPKAVEVDCIGRSNGIENGHHNNGSSIHDGGTIVRINGEYYENDGPNIADVNGAKSWNVACVARQSTPSDSNSTNFYNQGTMWLDNCESYGSENDLVVAGNGTTYTRNFLTEGKNIIGGGSKVVGY